MLLLNPASCLYAKTIGCKLFSNDNGLKKDSVECMKQFVSSLFNKHGIPFKTFMDKFPAIITSFQRIDKKSPEKRDKLKTTFGIPKWKKNEI